MRTLGWILLAAGIILLLVRSFSYTTNEKVADIGPVEINKKESHTVVWPFYAGGVIALAGLVLLVSAKKDR